MDSDDGFALELLLSRLCWPSYLVRERACSHIADLLLSSSSGGRVQAALLDWIARQSLESLAATALLVFCKVKDLGGEIPSTEELAASVRAPSILSVLLLEDLLGEGVYSECSLPHAKDAPADFVPDPFFERHNGHLIPPIFQDRAKRIQGKHRVPFENQWSYEWTRLHEESDIPPTAPDVDFWGRDRRRRLRAIDLPESEYYKSAYLRALAWATEKGALSEIEAKYLASELCPVHLDLWRVEPSARPDCWSLGDSATFAEVETAPGEILERIRTALVERGGVEAGWILCEASGSVHKGDVYFDVNVRGMVQASVGPKQPFIEQFHADWIQSAVRPSAAVPGLRLEGLVSAESANNWQYQCDDWLGWPLGCPIDYFGPSRWQPWRLERGVWAPAPWLTSEDYSVAVGKAQLEYCDRYGVFAKWTDWLSDYEELSDTDMPAASGQMLMIHRARAEAAAHMVNGGIAWTVQWTRYHRPNSYGDKIEKSRGCFSVGTTNIIRA